MFDEFKLTFLNKFWVYKLQNVKNQTSNIKPTRTRQNLPSYGFDLAFSGLSLTLWVDPHILSFCVLVLSSVVIWKRTSGLMQIGWSISNLLRFVCSNIWELQAFYRLFLPSCGARSLSFIEIRCFSGFALLILLSCDHEEIGLVVCCLFLPFPSMSEWPYSRSEFVWLISWVLTSKTEFFSSR